MIYICIPTYNEERTIGVMLWKIRQVMAEFQRDYQILVVDDASTDATPEVLEPYKRILPLTIHRNDERKGYAASVELLLREAVRRSPYPRRDAVVMLQADFTEEPDQIPALVKRIEGGADVVTTAVQDGWAQAPRGVRWTRRALGLVLRRRDWPEGAGDPLSGFRAYRVIVLKRLLEAKNGSPILECEGWAANVELLAAVLPYARRVVETPVAVRYDRRRRGTRFRAWDTGRQLLRFLRAKPGTNGREAPATRQEFVWKSDAPPPFGAARNDEARESATPRAGRRPRRRPRRRGGVRAGGRTGGPRRNREPRAGGGSAADAEGPREAGPSAKGPGDQE